MNSVLLVCWVGAAALSPPLPASTTSSRTAAAAPRFMAAPANEGGGGHFREDAQGRGRVERDHFDQRQQEFFERTDGGSGERQPQGWGNEFGGRDEAREREYDGRERGREQGRDRFEERQRDFFERPDGGRPFGGPDLQGRDYYLGGRDGGWGSDRRDGGRGSDGHESARFFGNGERRGPSEEFRCVSSGDRYTRPGHNHLHHPYEHGERYQGGGDFRAEYPSEDFRQGSRRSGGRDFRDYLTPRDREVRQQRLLRRGRSGGNHAAENGYRGGRRHDDRRGRRASSSAASRNGYRGGRRHDDREDRRASSDVASRNAYYNYGDPERRGRRAGYGGDGGYGEDEGGGIDVQRIRKTVGNLLDAFKGTEGGDRFGEDTRNLSP